MSPTIAQGLKPYRQTRAEQETIIRWDREDSQVHLFSANPAIWRKLTRLGIEPVRRSTVQGEEAGRFYTFPVTLLRWGFKSEARAQASQGRRLPPRKPRLAADSGDLPTPGIAG